MSTEEQPPYEVRVFDVVSLSPDESLKSRSYRRTEEGSLRSEWGPLATRGFLSTTHYTLARKLSEMEGEGRDVVVINGIPDHLKGSTHFCKGRLLSEEVFIDLVEKTRAANPDLEFKVQT